MNKGVVEIVEPSKEIFELMISIQGEIKEVVSHVKTKPIGSFAVPMCGKKEIDILIETDDVEKAQDLLSEIGFGKGPIVKGEGFCRKRIGDMICELHIVQPNNKKIKDYDKIIKVFQENKELREEFEDIKRSMNGKLIEEYKQSKKEFFASIKKLVEL